MIIGFDCYLCFTFTLLLQYGHTLPLLLISVLALHFTLNFTPHEFYLFFTFTLRCHQLRWISLRYFISQARIGQFMLVHRNLQQHLLG